MPIDNEKRVLGRENARDVSPEEFDRIMTTLRKGKNTVTYVFTSVFHPDV